MEFEDRLQSHLSQQAQDITINSEDPNRVANRSMARRRRTMSTAVAGFVIAASGFGWVAMNAGGASNTSTIVADESEQAAQIDDTQDGNASVAENFTEDAAAPSNSTSVVGDRDSTNVTVTGPVEAISIPPENSPGTYFGGAPLVADGVYYVLSTAPGEAAGYNVDGMNYYQNPPPNTLYSFDEATGWSIAPESDRFLSDLTARDGVLYALSTGSASGAEDLAIGSSSDRGQTWAWEPLAMDAPANATVSLEAVGDKLFIGTQTLPVPNWEEGFELLAESGFDLDSNDIWDIDATGFTYIERIVTECESIRDDWYQVAAPIYDEAYGPGGPFDYQGDSEPTAEQLDELLVLQQELQAQVRAAQEDARAGIEARLAAAGCDNIVACELASVDATAEFMDEQNEINQAYAELFAPYTTEPPADEFFERPEVVELNARADEFYDRQQQAIESAMAAVGCDMSTMYVEAAPADPESAIAVTWAELGLEPPASWSGSRQLATWTNGVLEPLTVPWGDDISTQVTSDNGVLQVTTMPHNSYFGGPVGPDSVPTLPLATEWTTADGLNWSTATASAVPGFGNEVQIGDRTFRISWGMPVPVAYPSDMPVDADGLPVPPPIEVLPTVTPTPIDAGAVAVPAAEMPPPMAMPVAPPSNTLEVSISGGPFTPVDLASFGLGVDLADQFLNQLMPTPLGVMLTMNANEPQASTVLYSPDGESWNRVDMAVDFVAPMVGEDSVMLMGQRWSGDGGPAEVEAILLRGER